MHVVSICQPIYLNYHVFHTHSLNAKSVFSCPLIVFPSTVSCPPCSVLSAAVQQGEGFQGGLGESGHHCS